MWRPRLLSYTFIAPQAVVVLIFAIGGLAYAFNLLNLPAIGQSEARYLAEAEVDRMCREQKVDCAPCREIQATDSGRVWLFIYAIPDARYGEVSAGVSKYWGKVELGLLARD